MKFILSGKKENLSDEEIIASYKRDKNLHWLDILFDRYSHLAFAVAYNYLRDEEESKDVVLSIFQKLGDDLHRFDIRNFSTWLHTVVRNKCLRFISKRIHTEELNPEHLPETSSEDALSNYIDMLEDALVQLNQEQQSCIRLFYFEKKSYHEISDITGYDQNKVKSYIQNGKRNLKLYLDKNTHE